MPTLEPKPSRKKPLPKTTTLNGPSSKSHPPRVPHATIGTRRSQPENQSFQTQKTKVTTISTKRGSRKPERSSILRQSSGNIVSLTKKSSRPVLRPKVKEVAIPETALVKPPPRLKLRIPKTAATLSQNAQPSIFTSGQTELTLELSSTQVSTTSSGFPLDSSILNNESTVLHESDNERERDQTSNELPVENQKGIDLSIPLETESIKHDLPVEKTTIRYVLSVPADRRKSRSTNDYNEEELTSDEEQKARRRCWRSSSLQDETPTKPLPKNPVLKHPQVSSASEISVFPFGHDVNKCVQWDPAIIATGPIIQTGRKNSGSKFLDGKNVREINGNISDNEEFQACVQTIRAWKKNDKKKVAQLLKALKELDSSDDENEYRQIDTGSQLEASIAEIQNLDPRVPEFESRKSLRTEARMMLPTSQPLIEKSHSESSLIENIQTSLSKQIMACQKSKAPKKRVVIDDDSNPWCREVDFTSQWYSRMQLEEFMKKYPLTGQKAPSTQRKISTGRTVNFQPMAKGRHAAAIQQRLEFLLLQQKERKAAAQLATQPPYFSYANFGGETEICRLC